MADTSTPQVPIDPLKMATNCLKVVAAVADAQISDPVDAAVRRLGTYGADSARLAARCAMVSIAQDLRRIADHFTGTAEHPTEQPTEEPDALTEALLTEARRHSTGYLLDTYARGIEFGHPWPPLKTAIEQVLTERGEPLPTTPEEG